MSTRAKIFTVDTAPVEVLRKAYRDLLERHQQGMEARHLGWWISSNAETITITTKTGGVITTTGAEALRAIKQYHEHERRHADERAA